MNIRFSAIPVLLAVATLATGCVRITKKDLGESVTRQLTVDAEFTEIETVSSTDVEYRQGPLGITLTAPEKRIDKIEVKVKDGVLKVSIPGPNNEEDSFPSKLVVSAPAVSKFTTTGTGDFKIDNIDTREIWLVTNGTGDINLKSAKCTKINAITTGTGDITAKYLSCLVAEFTTHGTGDIDVSRISADNISAKTTGTGDITLSGECRNTNFSSEGVGDINHRGLEILKPEEEQ